MLKYEIQTDTYRTRPSQETALQNVAEMVYTLQMVELMLEQNWRLFGGADFGQESRNLYHMAQRLEGALSTHFDRWLPDHS